MCVAVAFAFLGPSWDATQARGHVLGCSCWRRSRATDGWLGKSMPASPSCGGPSPTGRARRGK
eukprot:5057703-Alexandrium_andersonii.AAC.1